MLQTFRKELQQINTFPVNMKNIIKSICQENPEALILLGDFNDTCLTWNADHSERKNKLLNPVQANNLFSDHITQNTKSILNLIINDAQTT